MQESDVDDKCIKLGRGQNNYNHEGNKAFRDIIAFYLPQYQQAKKLQKTEVVRNVMQRIKKDQMKFVELRQGAWVELIDEINIRRKVAHRFRDAVDAERHQGKQHEEAVEQRVCLSKRIKSSTSLPVKRCRLSEESRGKSSNVSVSPTSSRSMPTTLPIGSRANTRVRQSPPSPPFTPSETRLSQPSSSLFLPDDGELPHSGVVRSSCTQGIGSQALGDIFEEVDNLIVTCRSK